MSDRINHAANSRRAIDTVRDWQEREGETDATMLAEVGIAQAEATLALVEQARIANLIALVNGDTHLSTTAYLQVAVEAGIYPAEFRPDIAAALGVETGAGDE